MTIDSTWLLLAQAASTLAMVGIIWFVQVVHYPMFRLVGPREFPDWERRNTRQTTLVVAPVMLVEAASSLGLMFLRGGGLAVAGAALLVIIWVSTAVLQVPAHTRLARGFDARVHRRLVQTNWIRTVCWTARGAIVLWWAAAGPT